MARQYQDHELTPFEARDFLRRLKDDPSPFVKGSYTFHAKDLNGMYYVEVFQNGNPTTFQYGYIDSDLDKAARNYEKELNRLTESINVRLTEAQFQYISEIAKTRDQTPSDTIREIIEFHMENR